MKTNSLLAVVCALGLLGACATPYQPQVVSDTRYPSQYVAYGVVETIQQSAGGIANTGIGAGTVIGGVVGGVLGNQIGGGTGKTIATVAGVAGGALIGREVDKSRQGNNLTYTIGVRLNNGEMQTIHLDGISDLRVGDRVRIENGQLYRY